MTREQLIIYEEFAISLSKGIDPTSGICFPSDTVMNHEKIRQYNKAVAKILHKLLQTGKWDSSGKLLSKKYPFHLQEGIIIDELLVEEAVTISSIVFRLNEKRLSGTCKLRAETITEWLRNEGYLMENDNYSERCFKKVTEKGIKNGISQIERVDAHNHPYQVNVYNRNAQKIVLEHVFHFYGN